MVDPTTVGFFIAGGIGIGWLIFTPNGRQFVKNVWEKLFGDNPKKGGRKFENKGKFEKKKGHYSEEETDEMADMIKYRGEEYEIDWKQKRFLKIWEDEKTGEFKEKSVKLPYHIWEEVFLGDEESDDGGDDDDYYR